MKADIVRRTLSLVASTAIVMALTAAQAGGQDVASINGRVVDALSKQPIPLAQIQVVGTTRGTTSGDDGTFRIANLPVAQYTLRALRIGYQAGSQVVTLSSGATGQVEFQLAPVAVSLAEVVTTATGETQRKKEIGSAVSTMQPKQENLANAQTASQLLSGKVPGVNVAGSGGTIGSGSRIRIRGANSVSLTNEPLIIVDGIRFSNAVGQDNTSGATSIGVGGQVPSRFNDINPEDIETIEVLKGPAAAAQYGTAAANGVIQITTKRGRTGKPRWNVFVEGGTHPRRHGLPGELRAGR